MSKSVKCPKCGYPNPDTRTTCFNCHASLWGAEIFNPNAERDLAVRNFFTDVRNFFVIIINGLINGFCALFPPSDEQILMENMYRNMSDQELIREKHNVEADIAKAKSMRTDSTARNVFLASKSDFFISAFILGSDIHKNSNINNLITDLEYQLDLINFEIKNRVRR